MGDVEGRAIASSYLDLVHRSLFFYYPIPELRQSHNFGTFSELCSPEG